MRGERKRGLEKKKTRVAHAASSRRSAHTTQSLSAARILLHTATGPAPGQTKRMRAEPTLCWKSSPVSSSSQSAVHSSWFSASTACASSLTTVICCVVFLRGQRRGGEGQCCLRASRQVERRTAALRAYPLALAHIGRRSRPLHRRPAPARSALGNTHPFLTMRGKLLKGVVLLQGHVLGRRRGLAGHLGLLGLLLLLRLLLRHGYLLGC